MHGVMFVKADHHCTSNYVVLPVSSRQTVLQRLSPMLCASNVAVHVVSSQSQ